MRKLICVALLIFLSGCNTREVKTYLPDGNDSGAQNSLLSYGMVKKALKPGESTQADVLKLFGSPTNMTYQSNGNELWVYDRAFHESYVDSDSSSSNAGLGVGAAKNSLGAIAGIGGSGSSISNRSISRTSVLTVILEFNGQGLLTDLSARKGGY